SMSTTTTSPVSSWTAVYWKLKPRSILPVSLPFAIWQTASAATSCQSSSPTTSTTPSLTLMLNLRIMVIPRSSSAAARGSRADGSCPGSPPTPPERSAPGRAATPSGSSPARPPGGSPPAAAQTSEARQWPHSGRTRPCSSHSGNGFSLHALQQLQALLGRKLIFAGVDLVGGEQVHRPQPRLEPLAPGVPERAPDAGLGLRPVPQVGEGDTAAIGQYQ